MGLDYFDHYAILISLEDRTGRDMIKSFKFKCAWILEESYKDMIVSAWNDNKGILHNLEDIRVKAKNWNMHAIKILLKAKTLLCEDLKAFKGKLIKVAAMMGLGRWSPICNKNFKGFCVKKISLGFREPRTNV